MGDWPPTYNAELFRASKPATGGFSFGTKVLPGWSATEFGERLRYFLAENGVEWAEDMLFQFQVRGVKGGTFHGCNRLAARTALDELLSDYTIDEEDQWFIDVGLEFSMPDPARALLWRTDCHTHVVSHLFANNFELAAKITAFGSKYYSRDLSSHLPDVSGCRVRIAEFSDDPVRNPSGIKYIQMYTNDKALTYQLANGRHSKHLTGNGALKGDPPQFVRGLFDAYMDAAPHNHVNSRIELRVPLSNACEVLTSWPNDLLSRTMMKFNRDR